MQELSEAVNNQQGKDKIKRFKPIIKPVSIFNPDDIKQIRKKTGLSQVIFAASLGVSPQAVEAWEYGKNKPDGASRRLLEIVRDDPTFLVRFQVKNQLATID
ncbi:MAG: helix-turn-helix domain-containing protein [Treponema sp.]|nr:helix-turn-helix domain-containing protein [Treponema sp.]